MGEQRQDNEWPPHVPRGSADDYAEVPYVSMPINFSDPARLEALGKLYGLTPPRAARASILEIGCASGGNLIPLAARFPSARFLGLDAAPNHIEAARRRAGALGLTNIEFQAADVTTCRFEVRAFDYIISHGVYSWVPEAAQKAILKICRASLSDNGLALISYNVLPGWHQRRIIRDLCLAATRDVSSAKDRISKARAIIAKLADAADPANAYGHLIKEEASRLKTLPGSYILGEFLSPFNSPVTFEDFTARAGQFALAYLSECDLASTYPEILVPTAAKNIREISGPDAMALQTFTDHFSGRAFRRSVLVHEKAAQSVRPPAAERLAALHICAPLKREKTKDGGTAFKDRAGRRYRTGANAAGKMIEALAAAYPSTLEIDSLMPGAAGGGARAAAAIALFELVLSGSATLTTEPFMAGRAGGENPSVWKLARLEAAAGQPWVTSPLHTGIPINDVLAFVLPMLDGATPLASIREAVAGALRKGQFDRDKTGGRAAPPTKTEAETEAAHDVKRGLEYLAVNGLLEMGNCETTKSSPPKVRDTDKARKK